MPQWYSPRRWWEWLNGEDISEEAYSHPTPDTDSVPHVAQTGPDAESSQQGEDYDGGRLYRLRPGGVTPSQNIVIVRAQPRAMDDAPLVADKIKESFPVTINLEGVEEATARRIVDFIGGVTYALDGSIKKVGRAVFLCSPSDIPIEDMHEEELPAPRDEMFEEQVERRIAAQG
jgi:FtsZ-interacting cell division protein YlmF